MIFFYLVSTKIEDEPGCTRNMHEGRILRSDDGYNWEQVISERATFRAVTWGNNMFVTVSWAGDILASSDGIKWKQVAGRYSTNLKDVIWTGEKFVAVGETKYDDEPEYNRVFVSTDGENWTYYQAPDEFQSIAWNGNVYVAVANGNNIYRSYDCVDWELVRKGYTDQIEFNKVE